MDVKIDGPLYSGKAKDVLLTDDPEIVAVRFRDDITAGDGEKKDTLEMKGYYNSVISAKIFEVLEEAGVPTQYLELREPGCILARKLEMIPIEVITRNIAAGSIVRRFPFTEGQEFVPPLIQMDYKSDEHGDPMLNDDIILALGIATRDELEEIRRITLQINSVLRDFLKSRGLILPDFKLEFGRDSSGRIRLGDEVSPDTCRLWDMETGEPLDKDIFRRGEEGVVGAYRRVARMILDDEDIERWNVEL
ncbi:phosphoribosylaminoimidazolesuccinocarboxamide synthase [Methanothermobacter thermautotrophicus]|jgi:phosphoribosylaminoimidazole-succinocarboxamide synthase|uniref:phosphoribosylaminoimidazolesuccinocarboxamide synthase n=1 Tax=Methanothermobacter thermautotrophicus TaxID=145262 RepID=UPI0022B9928F|nr:phosphoribosylaminoimidazolesuccinocarboxamide synthase [Methanothermobacter thermautotrophicus]MDI6818409.1 phosphoribosylaminoimidazolesuccinocarboxamide synthase [Methanothermobacter thermautotrophicus]WBF08290.1 phosphoribosylaminoimidazolesuccinocarboxamide synthase [Methanothermobacter thermautotrophicus]